jgi:hypothetical protein
VIGWIAAVPSSGFASKMPRGGEQTEAPVDEISWRVDYEDPALFRRLFKRTTGLAPATYRKRFRIPDYARPRSRGVERRRPAAGRVHQAANAAAGHPAMAVRARCASVVSGDALPLK